MQACLCCSLLPPAATRSRLTPPLARPRPSNLQCVGIGIKFMLELGFSFFYFTPNEADRATIAAWLEANSVCSEAFKVRAAAVQLCSAACCLCRAWMAGAELPGAAGTRWRSHCLLPALPPLPQFTYAGGTVPMTGWELTPEWGGVTIFTAFCYHPCALRYRNLAAFWAHMILAMASLANNNSTNSLQLDEVSARVGLGGWACAACFFTMAAEHASA